MLLSALDMGGPGALWAEALVDVDPAAAFPAAVDPAAMLESCMALWAASR